MTTSYAPYTDHLVRIREHNGTLDRYATDPVIAHLFGIIVTAPIPIEQLIVQMASIATRDIVLNHIQHFVALGILELVDPPQPVTMRRTIPPEETTPLRDYRAYHLAEEELAEPADIPRHLKQEILFLFKYGASLTHYKVLDISPAASDAEVRQAFLKRKDLLDPRRFAGKNLGTFAEKLDLARAIVEQTGILLDPEKRVKYDYRLAQEKTVRSFFPEKQEKKKKAVEYHAKAAVLAAKDDPESIREALRLIREALAIDPRNNEYKELEQKLEKINKQHKIEGMIFSLEQGDFDLFDGERLKKEIGKILDLGDHRAEVYLRTAQVMLDKGLLHVARKLAREGKERDPRYRAVADQLIKRVDEVLDYYKRQGKIIKE